MTPTRRRAWPGLLILLSLVLAGCASDAELDTLQPRGESARDIDDLLDFVMIVAGVVLVLVVGVILWMGWRNRVSDYDDDDFPAQTHGNNALEILWTVVPAAIMAAVAVLTVVAHIALNETEANAIEVEVDGSATSWEPKVVVVGQQWWWEYRYYFDDDVEPRDARRPVESSARRHRHIGPDGHPRGTRDRAPGHTRATSSTPIGSPLSTASATHVPGVLLPVEAGGRRARRLLRSVHRVLRRIALPNAHAGRRHDPMKISRNGSTPRWPPRRRPPTRAAEGSTVCRLRGQLRIVSPPRRGQRRSPTPEATTLSGSAPDLTHFASRTTFAGRHPQHLRRSRKRRRHRSTATRTGHVDSRPGRGEGQTSPTPSPMASCACAACPTWASPNEQIDDLIAFPRDRSARSRPMLRSSRRPEVE